MTTSSSGSRSSERRAPEGEIRRAQARLERLIEAQGLLLHHDATFPSATACIAGAPIRGSWWGHPKGKLIYETLLRVEPEVAWAKLVLGKETLIHRRLWPALVAAAESGQDWQHRDLPADAQALLERIRLGAPVRADGAEGGRGRRFAAVATELERRLLARGYSEHTASGKHVRFLETWGDWARRVGLGKRGRSAASKAIEALSAPVLGWTGGVERPGTLPWWG
jgi:hypothetical protein